MNINDYKDGNGNVEVSETLVSDLIGGINSSVVRQQIPITYHGAWNNNGGNWGVVLDNKVMLVYLTARDGANQAGTTILNVPEWARPKDTVAINQGTAVLLMDNYGYLTLAEGTLPSVNLFLFFMYELA